MRALCFTLLFLGGLSACYWFELPLELHPTPRVENSFRLAFGSCSKQWKPQPILRQVIAQKPDLFIYLGDNIYGDTRDMAELRNEYSKLGAKPEFQALRESTRVFAIWDDHDYGENDAGKNYPHKEKSKSIFMDFWRVPVDSPRRAHLGIYGVEYFGDKDRRVQVILLDTRTFRDPLLPNDGKKHHRRDYRPQEERSQTLLGAAQWRWLEEVLRVPARVRIVASSIQFAAAYSGYEAWANFPHERQRMMDLIAKTQANGVLFISGDVHYGEISKLGDSGRFTVYDVTASGLTETSWKVEPNKNRVGGVETGQNFGLIDIQWGPSAPQATLKLMNRAGSASVIKEISLP